MARSKFENSTELPYHVTARCINQDWFSLDINIVWDIMTRHLYFLHKAFNIQIHAFVLMSNHFHIIVRTPDANLSAAMRYFMRETSRDLTKLSSRINQTYGSRFHRSLLTDPLYYLHAYKYLYRNPVTAKIVSRVEDYPYSSLPGVLGIAKLEIQISEDSNWGSLASRDETLSWLNKTPESESLKQVKMALKKSIFKLPKEKAKNSPLENMVL